MPGAVQLPHLSMITNPEKWERVRVTKKPQIVGKILKIFRDLVTGEAMRVELVCGQLVGLAMMRYVLQVEPVASATADEIVRQFAPAIRATISTGS